MKLDDIIQHSLEEFVKDIFSNHWYGKEREAISLYAFGYLLRHCQSDGVLYDPRQIGIEVRVPKPTQLGKKVEICKDLVIWQKPSMTCWNGEKKARNYPLAVLEWKTNEPNVSTYDVKWLRAFSADSPKFIGYAICLNLSERNFRLTCTRVQSGSAKKDWLVL
jgi:hypothetical protein